ncbi:STAS domain-containing protein [Streptomyces erythrochromogenes]
MVVWKTVTLTCGSAAARRSSWCRSAVRWTSTGHRCCSPPSTPRSTNPTARTRSSSTSRSFCDSSGLAALVQARQNALAQGKRISLHGPQPHILRLLEVTGAHALFPITGT